MLYDTTYRSNLIKHQYFPSINPQCQAEWRELPLPPFTALITSSPSLTGWTGVITKQPGAFKHRQTRHILQQIHRTAVIYGGMERHIGRTENYNGEMHSAFTVKNIVSVCLMTPNWEE